MTSIDSKTDASEAISHIIDKILIENGGEVLYKHGRQMAVEKLQKIGANNYNQPEDFDEIAEEYGFLTVDTDQFGEDTITDVATIGARPDWLELPESAKQTNNTGQTDIPGIDTNGSTNGSATNTVEGLEDDFSVYDRLTEHQPAALKEAGFKTHRDLYGADVEELTDVAGVNQTTAEYLQSQASNHIDPVEEIAREAYLAETTTEEDTTDSNSKWDFDNAEADAHLVTDVPIPSGEPRDPNRFDGTNEPWHVFGLPVLKRPTLSPDILRNFVDEATDFDNLLAQLHHFIAYDEQFEQFHDAFTSAFGSLDDVAKALEPPLADSTTALFEQRGITRKLLDDTLAANESMNVSSMSPMEAANTIDRDLEDKAPVQTRVNLVHAIADIIDTENADIPHLRSDDILDTLLDAAATPVELDHPFIESIDSFPPLKTRTLETGEKDVEAAARIIAKNNYALDLVGHAGVGKDTIIRVLAALTNRPSVVINMDESMISQDLMGLHQIDDDGSITFKDGVIPHAAKFGYMLVISEVNAAAPEILTAFHQLLERNAKLHVKERDEVIEPSPRFRIATTRNPPTQEYDGAKELNGAFKRRLNSIRIGYLEAADEADLIGTIVNSDRTVIEREKIQDLVKMANDFRRTADSQSSMPRISTSKILHIIDLYDGSSDLRGAAKESVKASLGPMQMRNEESIKGTIEDHI